MDIKRAYFSNDIKYFDQSINNKNEEFDPNKKNQSMRLKKKN